MSAPITQKVLQSELGVSIDRLVIVTGHGNRIEESLQMIELNLFEDIFAHNMSATLVIDDAFNLIEKLHLCGQEWVFIRISKPGFENMADASDASISVLMRIYKIERLSPKSPFINRFMIHMCKEELILSHQDRISKTYRNTKPEAVIRDVFKNSFFYTSENMFDDSFEVYPIPSSTSAYTFNIPNMKPFDAITYAASLAINDSGINDFVFFESSNGYRFESLSTLYTQKPVFSVKYRVKNVVQGDVTSNDPYVNAFSPLAIETDILFDYIQSTMRGEFGIQCDKFDIATQTFISKPLSYSTFLKKYKGSKTLGGYSKVPKNDWGELTADGQRIPYYQIFYPVTSLAQENTVEFLQADAKATRIMQMASITNQKVKMEMPGNPFVRAGQILKLDYPSIETRSPEDTVDDLLDRYLASNYLVMSVRHVIRQTEWKTYCELSKDTLPNEIPDNFAKNFTLVGL